MMLLSYIRHSFTAQITLWVVGFAMVVMGIILIVLAHFLYPTLSSTDGNGLVTTALLTAGATLTVLTVVCWRVASHHLRPLNLLADSAQYIADNLMADHQQQGTANLIKIVPNSGQKDEIGQLQNSFATMQRALADYMTEMQQKRDTLSQHNTELQAAYAYAREADSVKARFLGQMSEQMGQAVEAIEALTNRLCDHYTELPKAELMKIQIQMLAYTETVTSLLDKMLNSSIPTPTKP